MNRGRLFLAAWAAAIVAVVSLSYASAQSIVMRAGASAGLPARAPAPR